jgi:hypothetical protein
MRVHVLQGHLLPQPVFALAQRADPAPNRGAMLADAEVEPLHKGRVDVPTSGGEPVLDGLQGAKHHAVLHVAQALAAHGLHHLGIEPPGQRHPTGLGRWPFVWAAWRWAPGPLVGQQSRQRPPEPIGEQQRSAVRRPPRRSLVDHARGQGERAIPAVERQPPLALRVQRAPDPLGHALPPLAGLSLTDLAVLDGAEQGEEFVQLSLPAPHIVQAVSGKGLELLRRVDQPLQPRIGLDLDPPRRAPDAQPFGQARDDAHDELDGDTLAMEEGAKGLEKIATTDHPQQLPPGATVRMAMGTESAPAHPAAIRTGWVRTAMA